MNANALLYYATETVRDTFAKASRAYGRDFILPAIKFDLCGETAGWACYKRNIIRLNIKLFEDNVDSFITDTIPHEVAHLVSNAVYGREGRGHKARWKSVMLALGVSDSSRCHSYTTTPARILKRVTYVCDCLTTHNLTLVKANRLKRNPNHYLCRHCKGRLISSTR